jgi:hypothetical protein
MNSLNLSVILVAIGLILNALGDLSRTNRIDKVQDRCTQLEQQIKVLKKAKPAPVVEVK